MNTRIAPSPTGTMHLGTARTAYFNWLAARSTGGKFILRIDDTDLARNDDAHVDVIYDTMSWLGLDFDITFRQSQRLKRYADMADAMVDAGYAIRKDDAVFFRSYDLTPIDVWTDSICGIIKCDNSIDGIDKMVLIKSDGMPSYHFATVVDDIDYGIDWIIRGVDHISNTVKHKYIAAAICKIFPIAYTIKYSHVGLIHYNGKKMSKRDNVSGVDYYRDNGYLPGAVLNSMLMLGWGHPDSSFDSKYPIVDKDLAVVLFPQGKMRNVDSKLNLQKMDWFNKKYKNILRNNV